MRLREDLARFESSGDDVLLKGDMNRAVGSDELGVAGNHNKVSHGGQLFREMVKEHNYIAVNILAIGGPWTTVQRGKEYVKSCLDLAYASQNLLPFIKSLVIDNNKTFTPRRVIWKKGGFSLVYTDHFPIQIVFSGMPRRIEKVEEVTSWNFGKPGGWQEYQKLR